MKALTSYVFALVMAAMVAFATPSNANQIFSHTYGNWELMAWNGNNKFCALKTYIGGRTFSIRATSADGIELVVYDPNVRFLTGEAPADVGFNGQFYGTYMEYTYDQWPSQVFIHIGHDWDFLDLVESADTIHIQSEDVDYHLNLIGTELLAQHLYNCVDRFGF